MSKRKQQIKDKLSIDFFNKEGRLPDSVELNKLLISKDIYSPQVTPELPLKGATSSAEKLSSLFKDMLLERRNMSDIMENMKERIARLKDSIAAETNNFLKGASAIVRKYKDTVSRKIYYKGDVMSPIVGSTNVAISGGGVSLERSTVKSVAFLTKISPYTSQSGANPSLRTIKSKDPITLSVQGTKGFEKGAEITLELKDKPGYISELFLDVDPCYSRIRLDGRNENYIEKFISGPTTLAIGKTLSTITIILYDTPAIINFRIREMKLYDAVYSGSGTYNTGEYLTPPFTVESSSFILDPDEYLPDDTEIKWYYAKDDSVDGYFGSGTGSNPFAGNLNAPYSELEYVDDNSDYGMLYSSVYNYDESIVSPLVWTEFEKGKAVNWNATEQTGFNNISTEAERHLIKIGKLNDNFDANSVAFSYGQDMWLFESSIMVGADRVRSVMTVEAGGYVLDMVNPFIIGNYPLFERMVIKGVDNDIEEDINIQQNTSFTYTLDEGKYNIFLYLNTLNQDFKLISTVVTLDDTLYVAIDAINAGYTLMDVLKAVYPGIPFDFFQLTAPDVLGRSSSVKISEGFAVADKDELIYSRDESIYRYAITQDGYIYVPSINYINGYGLIPAVDPNNSSTPDKGHPYLTGTCSNTDHTTESACTGAGATWTVTGVQKMDQLYTNHPMLNKFYDISYNIKTDTTLDKLFLRAVMKGNKSKSPVIRALEVTSE